MLSYHKYTGASSKKVPFDKEITTECGDMNMICGQAGRVFFLIPGDVDGGKFDVI